MAKESAEKSAETHRLSIKESLDNILGRVEPQSPPTLSDDSAEVEGSQSASEDSTEPRPNSELRHQKIAMTLAIDDILDSPDGSR